MIFVLHSSIAMWALSKRSIKSHAILLHIVEPTYGYCPTISTPPKERTLDVVFTNPISNSMLLDNHFPIFILHVNRFDVPNVIIACGSCFNIINEHTCHWLDLNTWPTLFFFLLQMAKGRLVRPIGLIKDLIIWVYGYPIHTSIVVLWLTDMSTLPFNCW